MRKPLFRMLFQGSSLSLLCCMLCGCRGIAYPLKHYADAYTKAALEVPAPDAARMVGLPKRDVDRIEHGRYLVQIAGCAACHTDGALVGEPILTHQLAGSHLGIAYTDPFTDGFPGIAYPANLTPDAKTGLGAWADNQIAEAIRNGRAGNAPGHLVVMSWPLYQQMTDEDVNAIVEYLRSIPAVENKVPTRVSPGTRGSTSYVYFGVFRSGPRIQVH
jgi:mono/diheme cytochrome c family protein